MDGLIDKRQGGW